MEPDKNSNSYIPDTSGKNLKQTDTYSKALLVFPLLICLLVFLSFLDGVTSDKEFSKTPNLTETQNGKLTNTSEFNILSSEDLTTGIKDTVYTNRECWLELRIDQQMVYQHWRNGKTDRYPVSTGNNHQGDPTALESRPGLFAIFIKEEHHISTQFNSANMYHFMPFNQGIGFHSIDGTAYYSHLGVRPSSHGCIRMKHEDAKKLYNDCPLGTLVIASRGSSARTIAFLPKDFKNSKEYTKEDYKQMLAENLYNLLSQKYYMEEREKFVVDPKVIPVSGVYTAYDRKVPEKQVIPRSFISIFEKIDEIGVTNNNSILAENHSDEFIKLISINEGDLSDKAHITKITDTSMIELVRKYFHNPIGVLPYFGPRR